MERRAVEPLLRIARDHSRKRDRDAIYPLLGFQDPQIDRQLLAELEKGGREFRLRLVDVVGTRVAHHVATPVAVRWIEQIARDDSLGDLQRVAQHNLQMRKSREPGD